MVAALGLPAPPSRETPTAHWWRYVDEARTHDVLAQWLDIEGYLLVRETARAAPEPYEERITTRQPWEARVALWALECRLAALGPYWRLRSIDRGWSRIGRPIGLAAPDARPAEIFPHERLLVHHYHDEQGRADQLVAALRRAGDAERYQIVRAELDATSLELGRMRLLSANVAAPVMRSLVTREQMAMAETGMAKLVTRDDYRRAFGHAERASMLGHEIETRVVANQWERPARARSDDEEFQLFLSTLNDKRLLALHARFLGAREEELALAGGPPAIRKLVHDKRALAEHGEQHLLTILEASLLARERMRSGRLSKWDPEVRALTRLAFYL